MSRLGPESDKEVASMSRKRASSLVDSLPPEVLQDLLTGTPDDARRAIEFLSGQSDAVLISADDLTADPSIPTDVIYEVKITLSGCRPAIMRTIAVRDMTLGDLHFAIQIAMGWQNCHMHEFEVKGTKARFSSPEFNEPSPFGFDFGPQWDNEEAMTLSRLVASDHRRLVYVYDFGDGWTHEILISKPKPSKPELTYPCCLKGQFAGPPEDCGGIWGYLDLVDALHTPPAERTEDQRERLEWLGRFDPEKFDPAKVTKALQKAFPPPKRRNGAGKKRGAKPAKSKS
jgi:hypothetical protein